MCPIPKVRLSPGAKFDSFSILGVNIADQSAPFLDDDCKTDHPDDEQNRWKCYDEGHVALYHMKEDVFFFESLADQVHEGDASPVFWMEPKPGNTVNPGFVLESPLYVGTKQSGTLHSESYFTKPQSSRHARFRCADRNAHDMVKQPAFYDRRLKKGGALSASSYSFAELLEEWQLSNANAVPIDAAVVAG